MSNPEWVITLLVPISALLFGLGGGGFKWARRFVLPVVLVMGADLLGIPWPKHMTALPLIIGAMCLGYGENHALWRKILTVLSFGVCLLPLANGINALLCLIPIVSFGCGYYLSLRINWVNWRLVELCTGGVLGGAVVLLALSS